jgi:hypothetical protein
MNCMVWMYSSTLLMTINIYNDHKLLYPSALC